MQIRPALDVRAGRVVRLGQHGDFATETAYAEDPDAAVGLARGYIVAGAHRLHVVDLDAARGAGDNRALVERLVAEVGAQVEVAGGIRSLADAERWLTVGAIAVVVGTAAVRDPALLAQMAMAYPGRVAAALDVRGGRAAIAGWASIQELTVVEVLARWEDAPLEGVIVTSVDRDGTLAGPDVELLDTALAATRHPVAYSGGVASLADIRTVAAAGAAAVILGKSLLEGHIPLAEALALS